MKTDDHNEGKPGQDDKPVSEHDNSVDQSGSETHESNPLPKRGDAKEKRPTRSKSGGKAPYGLPKGAEVPGDEGIRPTINRPIFEPLNIGIPSILTTGLARTEFRIPRALIPSLGPTSLSPTIPNLSSLTILIQLPDNDFLGGLNNFLGRLGGLMESVLPNLQSVLPIIDRVIQTLELLPPLVVHPNAREATKLGWVVHRTLPMSLLDDATEEELDDAIMTHYTDEWDEVRSDIELTMGSYLIDQDSKEAMEQALQAHEEHLYRLPPRALLPEIERVLPLNMNEELADRRLNIKEKILDGVDNLPMSSLRSSSKVTSRTQWARFSIPQCPRETFNNRSSSGGGSGQTGERIAYPHLAPPLHCPPPLHPAYLLQVRPHFPHRSGAARVTV